LSIRRSPRVETRGLEAATRLRGSVSYRFYFALARAKCGAPFSALWIFPPRVGVGSEAVAGAPRSVPPAGQGRFRGPPAVVGRKGEPSPEIAVSSAAKAPKRASKPGFVRGARGFHVKPQPARRRWPRCRPWARHRPRFARGWTHWSRPPMAWQPAASARSC